MARFTCGPKFVSSAHNKPRLGFSELPVAAGEGAHGRRGTAHGCEPRAAARAIGDVSPGTRHWRRSHRSRSDWPPRFAATHLCHRSDNPSQRSQRCSRPRNIAVYERGELRSVASRRRKAPCSSRFHNSTRPDPSQAAIFSRSARLDRKMKNRPQERIPRQEPDAPTPRARRLLFLKSRGLAAIRTFTRPELRSYRPWDRDIIGI